MQESEEEDESDYGSYGGDYSGGKGNDEYLGSFGFAWVKILTNILAAK